MQVLREQLDRRDSGDAELNIQASIDRWVHVDKIYLRGRHRAAAGEERVRGNSQLRGEARFYVCHSILRHVFLEQQAARALDNKDSRSMRTDPNFVWARVVVWQAMPVCCVIVQNNRFELQTKL